MENEYFLIREAVMKYMGCFKGNINKYIIHIVFGVFFIIAMYISSFKYLMFHTICELLIIIVSFSIMTITLNMSKSPKNDYFIFLGITYGFVACIELLHTLSYRGMNIIDIGSTANIPTQLWIAVRYLESISILVSFSYIKKKINILKVFVSYAIIVVLIILSIFKFHIFPNCFIEGYGLTPFKMISEYIIIVILGVCLFISYDEYNINFLSDKSYSYFIIFSIGSELAFTIYRDVYGIINGTGHVLKFISFYILYSAIIKETLGKNIHKITDNGKILKETEGI